VTIIEGVVLWAVLMLLIAFVAFLIRRARRGGRVIQVVGAAFTLMTMGNVRDPSNERVEVAKQPRKKESGDTGDPPNE
jgi:hypothetical protein